MPSPPTCSTGLEAGIELDPDVPPEMERALALGGRLDQDAAIRDIEATIRRARDESGGRKVGCVGYCLGGRLAFMAACRTDVQASVGYYGVGIDGLLGEAQRDRPPGAAPRPHRRPFRQPRRRRRPCTRGWTTTRR